MTDDRPEVPDGLRRETASSADARDEPAPGTSRASEAATTRLDGQVPHGDRLDDLVDRLGRAAEQLRSGELSPDAAAGLVEDLAGLAAEAAAELERRARAAAAEAPHPGQDQLL